MQQRSRMGRRGSKRYFTRNADKIHRKNLNQGPRYAMRGGIRI